MYKPLPDSLTIKQSGINGLGLFAREGIGQGTNLGMCHLELGQLTIRTPLGGFINHSPDANCVKVKLLLTRQEWNHRSDLPNADYNVNFKKWNLITLQDIKEGEELTVKYTFYKV
jgi:SET domain-containing protein